MYYYISSGVPQAGETTKGGEGEEARNIDQ